MPLNEFENPGDWDTQTEFSFSYDLGLAGEFTVDFEKIPTISTCEIEATEKK